ncbi:MAG: class I SAM-dependent RNA methyltransferase, partial [Oligoflexia bacterium]
MSSLPLRSFFASVPLGMESLLEQELQSLGASALVRERAGVRFESDLATAYKICLWSRLASRILLPIAQFAAPDAKKLYGGVKSIRWRDHLKPEGTLAIDVTQSGQALPELRNTHFVALKAKDAICDQFMSTAGVRPSVQLEQPDLQIRIHLEKGQATVSLDLSGDSLHRRGYRAAGAQAPLKENLAAAILILAGWPELSAPGVGFVDLMCGSGTLPIEAALMSTRTAPGFQRRILSHVARGHDGETVRRLPG